MLLFTYNCAERCVFLQNMVFRCPYLIKTQSTMMQQSITKTFFQVFLMDEENYIVIKAGAGRGYWKMID